jgi:hypothetical protein
VWCRWNGNYTFRLLWLWQKRTLLPGVQFSQNKTQLRLNCNFIVGTLMCVMHVCYTHPFSSSSSSGMVTIGPTVKLWQQTPANSSWQRETAFWSGRRMYTRPTLLWRRRQFNFRIIWNENWKKHIQQQQQQPQNFLFRFFAFSSFYQRWQAVLLLFLDQTIVKILKNLCPQTERMDQSLCAMW